MMRSKNSYTIVFNNEQKSKHNLQKAGRNIVDGGEVPNIADYYNMKFKKKMDDIEEENDENDDRENDKKVNNFVGSAKKSEKAIESNTNSKPVKPKEKVTPPVMKPRSQEDQKPPKTTPTN